MKSVAIRLFARTTPTYANYYAIIVHKTGKPEDAIAARLAEYLNNPVTGNILAEMGYVS